MADSEQSETQTVKKRRNNLRCCCVPGCKRDPQDKLSFHALPRDENVKKQWLRNIQRDIKITEYTSVCSKHFLPTDFKRSLTGLRRALVKGAVPSVFNVVSVISGKKKRTSPRKKRSVRKASEDTEEQHGASDCDTETNGHTDQQTASSVQRLSFKRQLEAARHRILHLQDLLAAEKRAHFSLARFAGNDSKIQKYTGLRDYQLFKEVFGVLQPTAQSMTRWREISKNSVSVENCHADAFRNESLPLIDQFFMVLCMLKIGFDVETLSDVFRVSETTASETLLSWVNYLYSVLGAFTVWPHRAAVQARMPDLFKKLYPKTRVILGRTAMCVQTPNSSAKVLDSMANSDCKTTIYNGIIGMNPDGTVVFVSSLYTGNMSDKDITARSGLVDLLEDGDEVMVDKAFPIQDLLSKKKASLVVLPLLGHEEESSSAHFIPTQDIVRLRDHFDRAVGRVTDYEILQQVIPLILTGCASQLWTVCALLANFREEVC